MSKQQKVVSYNKDSVAKKVVRLLLDNTGKKRNNRPSDYRYVQSVAIFGNETGFVTMRQLSLLGRMYNRVLKDQGESWDDLTNSI